MFVTDYSSARPGGQRLLNAGCVGAVRYAAQGRGDVNISRGEVDDLHAHGIAVGIVNEHEADYMLHRNGHTCAAQAEDIAGAAGLPLGPTYFAMDFDATNGGPTFPGSPGDQNMTRIANFLNSAASRIGEDDIGGYGSYYALQWLRDHLGWRLKWEWQTEAWSHGLILPGITMYQHASASSIPGCDFDSTIFSNWGQRSGNGIGPDIHRFDYMLGLPLVGDRFVTHGVDVIVVQDCLNDLVVPGFTPIAVDGYWGPNTRAAVVQYQRNRRLYNDGIVGKQTWADFHTLLLQRGVIKL